MRGVRWRKAWRALASVVSRAGARAWRWLRPKSRAERRHAILAMALLAGLGAIVFTARAGTTSAPRFRFAEGVVALEPLFRAGIAAEGSELTLREVYDQGFRIWSKQAAPAAQRLRGGGELPERLRMESKKAKRTTLLDLERIVAMESAGKIEVGTNRSGYTGLFQLGAAACSDVGVAFEEVARDWRRNLEAGVRFCELLHQRLSDALAKDPQLAAVDVDPFLLYLAHQQGVSGCMQILRQVKSGAACKLPANKNLANNLLPGSTLWKALTRGERKPTVLEFFVFVRGAFDSVADALR